MRFWSRKRGANLPVTLEQASAEDAVPACSWRGTVDRPAEMGKPGSFPCFRKASVRLREVYDREHRGNPFKERDVCRVHADVMVASGWYSVVSAAPEDA